MAYPKTWILKYQSALWSLGGMGPKGTWGSTEDFLVKHIIYFFLKLNSSGYTRLLWTFTSTALPLDRHLLPDAVTYPTCAELHWFYLLPCLPAQVSWSSLDISLMGEEQARPGLKTCGRFYCILIRTPLNVPISLGMHGSFVIFKIPFPEHGIFGRLTSV